MTDFYNAVYETVSRIPEGKVTTYGAIAAYLGSIGLSRAVGNALHNNMNPSAVPCHRVVNRSGALAPAYAFGGREEQRKRLIAEGVTFSGENVDLKVCLWLP